MSGWRIHIEDKPWLNQKDLWAAYRNPGTSELTYAVGFIMSAPIPVPHFQKIPDTIGPLVSATGIDEMDRVTTFLQATLDAAWAQGLRPTGVVDHAEEVTAIRYHLEDMRALAFKGSAPVSTKPRR